MADITNTELRELLLQLQSELQKNTLINEELRMLIKDTKELNKEMSIMLKENNHQTKAVYDYVQVQLSPEQELRDFLINTGANLVGNAIAVPTLINLKGNTK